MEIVQDLLCYEYIHSTRASPHKRYLCLRKVMLRHLCPLHVLKGRNKCFSFSQCFILTFLDNLVLVGHRDKVTLFLVCSAKVFLWTKMLCSTPYPSISMLFRYSIRQGKSRTTMEASWWRTWNHTSPKICKVSVS